MSAPQYTVPASHTPPPSPPPPINSNIPPPPLAAADYSTPHHRLSPHENANLVQQQSQSLAIKIPSPAIPICSAKNGFAGVCLSGASPPSAAQQQQVVRPSRGATLPSSLHGMMPTNIFGGLCGASGLLSTSPPATTHPSFTPPVPISSLPSSALAELRSGACTPPAVSAASPSRHVAAAVGHAVSTQAASPPLHPTIASTHHCNVASLGQPHPQMGLQNQSTAHQNAAPISTTQPDLPAFSGPGVGVGGSGSAVCACPLSSSPPSPTPAAAAAASAIPAVVGKWRPPVRVASPVPVCLPMHSAPNTAIALRGGLIATPMPTTTIARTPSPPMMTPIECGGPGGRATPPPALQVLGEEDSEVAGVLGHGLGSELSGCDNLSNTPPNVGTFYHSGTSSPPPGVVPFSWHTSGSLNFIAAPAAASSASCGVLSSVSGLSSVGYSSSKCSSVGSGLSVGNVHGFGQNGAVSGIMQRSRRYSIGSNDEENEDTGNESPCMQVGVPQRFSPAPPIPSRQRRYTPSPPPDLDLPFMSVPSCGSSSSTTPTHIPISPPSPSPLPACKTTSTATCQQPSSVQPFQSCHLHSMSMLLPVSEVPHVSEEGVEGDENEGENENQNVGDTGKRAERENALLLCDATAQCFELKTALRATKTPAAKRVVLQRSEGYDVVCLAMQYFRKSELGEVSLVCRMWAAAALSPAVWGSVRVAEEHALPAGDLTLHLGHRLGLIQRLNLANTHGAINNAALLRIAEHCPRLTFLDMGNSCTVRDEALCLLATKCTRLECLYLSQCHFVTNVSVSCLLMNCPRLSTIHLTECICITAEGFLFPEVNRLTNLGVRDTGITSATLLDVLRRCRHLRKLWCTRMTNECLMDSLATCPNLIEFHIKDASGLSTSTMVEYLKRNTSMLALGLRNCQEPLGQPFLEALAGSRATLEYLALSECSSLPARNLIPFLATCPTLKSLILSPITDEADDAAAWEALVTQCNQFTQLFVTSSKAGGNTLGAVRHSNHLRRLSLFSCGLSDWAVPGPDAALWRNLRHLSVAYNREVTDYTIVQIVNSCPRLEALDLDNTDVGVHTIEALCAQKRVTYLNVSGCANMTGAALRLLATCSQLVTLRCTHLAQVQYSDFVALSRPLTRLRYLGFTLLSQTPPEGLSGLAESDVPNTNTTSQAPPNTPPPPLLPALTGQGPSAAAATNATNADPVGASYVPPSPPNAATNALPCTPPRTQEESLIEIDVSGCPPSGVQKLELTSPLLTRTITDAWMPRLALDFPFVNFLTLHSTALTEDGAKCLPLFRRLQSVEFTAPEKLNRSTILECLPQPKSLLDWEIKVIVRPGQLG